MQFYDLTTDENITANEPIELSEAELADLSGGAGSFLLGDVAIAQGSLTGLGSGGQTASFPLSISNARFTQSGTTLCNWEKCTVYISGC